MSEYKMHLLVCSGTGCKASESEEIINSFSTLIDEFGLDDDVQIVRTGCFGFCEKGPIVKVLPDNTFYVRVTPHDTEEILREHVIKGRAVQRLLYTDPVTNKNVSDSKGIEFYKKQIRIALRNCGFINPENIEEYIARDGWFLAKNPCRA